MLTARRAILGLALLLAMIGDSSGQSQRRSQQVRVKQPETAVTQEESHEDKRGTEQSPLIVKVAPTPKTDEQRIEETKERERIANTERKKEQSDAKLVEFTGELAWFTKGLFVATSALVIATLALGVAAFFQSRDMKSSTAAAETAAKAAMLQAKAVIEVELPIIAARNFVVNSVGGIYSAPGELPEHPLISVRFYNYGRSPAEMLGFHIVPKIINKLPSVPENVEIYPVAPGTMIERSSFLEFTYRFEWNRDQRSKILAGETRLWIYGSVTYRDFLGNRHDVGFCAMAIPGPKNRLAFVYSSDTPPAYTYRKSE
jgi:hypothetical protein